MKSLDKLKEGWTVIANGVARAVTGIAAVRISENLKDMGILKSPLKALSNMLTKQGRDR